MIYGTPLYHIDDDQTDRLGIRTLVIHKMWNGSRSIMTVDELDAEEPPAPEVPGGVLFVGRQRRRNGGVLRTSWSFEGIDGNGRDKTPTFKDRTNSLDYQFDPGFSQVSILKSGRWRKLRDQFGGEVLDGQVIWPDTTPAQTNSGMIKGSGEGEPNPMFGHDDYYRIEGTYSFSYLALDLVGVTSGIAQIHSTGGLPGRAPHYEGRDWLKAPVVYRRVGPAFRLTEIYWLSGDGGWPEPIYGRVSGQTGSGLTTGTLTTGGL